MNPVREQLRLVPYPVHLLVRKEVGGVCWQQIEHKLSDLARSTIWDQIWLPIWEQVKYPQPTDE